MYLFWPLQVVCANVKLLWCPVGCLAWKPACELCVSFGWHQLAGIVCKRWRGPVGALPIPSFARLDLADVGAGEAQRAVPEPGQGLVASLSRKSYKDTFSPAYTVLYSSVRTRVGRITAARQPEGPWMFFLPFISPTTGLTFWINCHYCRFLFFLARKSYRDYNAFLLKHCPNREKIDAETITRVSKSLLMLDKTICTASLHTTHKPGRAPVLTRYQLENHNKEPANTTRKQSTYKRFGFCFVLFFETL